jgi:hypothetical protein
MRKLIVVLSLFASVAGFNFAQENQRDDNPNLYTVFVNIVNEQFRFPLIGFVNIAGGNHSLPQIGFINWNQNNFSTLQLGFINAVGGDMAGLQTGFVNTTAGRMSGVQLGFVNTTVNEFNGAQIAFANITKRLNGLQLGFINYSDSIEKGIPVGFLSIVRNGGYKAIELGVSEISPFNLSFKIGVEKWYTSFVVSYNPFKDGIRDQFVLGAGFGSIITLDKTFFLNPEILSQNPINGSGDFQHYLSFIPYVGYNVIPNLSIVAGPSVIWSHADKEMRSPFYSIMQYSINDHNELHLGARMALRFRW